MTRRPRRPLSAEERRLWAEVARSVRPLVGRRPEAAGDEAIVVPEPEKPGESPPTGAREARPARAVSPAEAQRTSSPPPLTGLDRRAARDLARGRTGPAASLDLHGLTQADAHARLIGFLRRAQAAGDGLVLVITGRGSPGGNPNGGERGVLRRSVPLWLGEPALRGLVLGFAEAGPRQGGAGALYVRDPSARVALTGRAARCQSPARFPTERP